MADLLPDTRRVTTTREIMTPEEFVERGLLMEINRLYLHPLGLALSVTYDRDGYCRLGPVYRTSDPEGFVCEEFTEQDIERTDSLRRARSICARVRRAALGWVVQPCGEETATEKAQRRADEAIVTLEQKINELINLHRGE